MRTQTSGFTLVELSIVLVIIGLLIGGILGGQELIRASELNRTYSDTTKIKVAANAFRLKYNQLPGDLNNATSYWSTASNGNGNGRIDNWSIESIYYWSHLRNAGIYNATLNADLWGAEGPMKGDYFYPYYGDLYTCQAVNENLMILSGGLNSTTSSANTVAWTTDDAFTVDGKYDDGVPTAGKIRGCDAMNATGAIAWQTCISGNTYTNLGLGTERCKLLFY